MASFDPFVRAGVQPGAREQIWAQLLLWLPVGGGTITAYDPYSFRFEGSIAAVFLTGDLVIALDLLDRDPAAPSGPCAVRLNQDQAVSAGYRVDGNRLVITARFETFEQEVAVSRSGCGRYTLLACTGRYTASLRLDTAAGPARS